VPVDVPTTIASWLARRIVSPTSNGSDQHLAGRCRQPATGRHRPTSAPCGEAEHVDVAVVEHLPGLDERSGGRHGRVGAQFVGGRCGQQARRAERPGAAIRHDERVGIEEVDDAVALALQVLHRAGEEQGEGEGDGRGQHGRDEASPPEQQVLQRDAPHVVRDTGRRLGATVCGLAW